ncbi:MAG TPA: histidine kinase [Pseudonocardiaceae bacterium]|jgi:signal transduction histidine kinase|nr:histidine kinase [Pseudonocardiaceae bacterium]
MSVGRPPSRLVKAAEGFFIERRWWLFVPIPLTVATLAIYRGPYRIAGGHWATYAAAAAVAIASSASIALPQRSNRWGPAVLVVMCVAAGVVTVAIPQSWTLILPYLLATVATRRYHPRVAIWVILASAASITAINIGTHGGLLPLVASLAILATLTLGAVVRRGRADRVEHMELALAREQAAHEEHARAAALAERARIAREVHDVLAHSLSALSLNLEGARLMLARDGASEQAQEQIRRAHRLATDGLAEARRAVAALRDDPVPAARAIAGLVDTARLESGTPIALTVEGTPRDLPGPAEDALYRTAQEALSNARKHATGSPVDVLLAYRDGSTELTVTDHQGHRPAGPATGGYGLTGMRERAELIGGELATGPTDDGWRVRLVVPA